MCVVSMVGDVYDKEIIPGRYDWWPNAIKAPEVKLSEFVDLKLEVSELKQLVTEMISMLKRAKLYDEANSEPECENDDKMAKLRKLAEVAGLEKEFDEVFV